MPESSTSHPFYTIGKNYLVCTVTRYHIGRLSAITDTELVLEDSSWIADTGRWSNAVKGLEALLAQSGSEIEPTGTELLINRGSIVDVIAWDDALPTGVK